MQELVWAHDVFVSSVWVATGESPGWCATVTSGGALDGPAMA